MAHTKEKPTISPIFTVPQFRSKSLSPILKAGPSAPDGTATFSIQIIDKKGYNIMRRLGVFVTLLALLMGVLPASGQGGVLFEDDFSDAGTGWEIGEYDGGDVGYGSGYYFVTSEGSGDLMWGLAGQSFDSITIEVEATQVRAPANDNNGYGVMCHVQDDGMSGYLLRISGDGYANITLIQDSTFTNLVEWTPVSAVNLGNATNQIQAVCEDSLLQLSANGIVLVQANDTTYTSGDIALAATSFEDNELTEIHFDNIVVTGEGGAAPSAPTPPDDKKGATAGGTTTGGEQPTGPSNILYEDDFSTENGFWPVGQNKQGAANYEDGGYFVSSFDPAVITYAYYEGGTFSDTVIDVQTTQIEAPTNDNNGYGVMCRVQPGGNAYYVLRISGDGYASILRKNEDDSNTMLVEWTPIGAISQGNSTNDLRVVCEGSRLALYVNGEAAVEASDEAFTEGFIGFAVSTYEDEDTKILYDDILVVGPQDSAGGSGTDNTPSDDSAGGTTGGTSSSSGFPARLANFGGGWQSVISELESAGAIPDGQLLFQEDRAFFSGQGSFFMPLASRSPRANIVMAGDVTYTPSGSSEFEECGLLARLVEDASGNSNTFLKVGLTNAGEVYYAELIGGEVNFDGRQIPDAMNTPHHFLFVANGDSFTFYLDGELLFEDVRIDEHVGGYGVGMDGQGPQASCVGEDLWVYELFTPFTAGECSVRSSGSVNRRTGPGTTFSAAGQTAAGQTYDVIDSRVGGDGFTWWQLADESWVRSDVVEEIGACGPTVP
jgi:hypothetical protein